MGHAAWRVRTLGSRRTLICFPVVVILILFGPKQLPEIARMAGKVIREFRNAMDGVKEEITQTMNEVTPPITKPEDILKDEFKEEKKEGAPKKES